MPGGGYTRFRPPYAHPSALRKRLPTLAGEERRWFSSECTTVIDLFGKRQWDAERQCGHQVFFKTFGARSSALNF